MDRSSPPSESSLDDSGGTSAYHRFAVDDVLAGDAGPDEVLVWLAVDRVVPLDRVSSLVEGSRVVDPTMGVALVTTLDDLRLAVGG